MAKQLNVSVQVTADTSQAQAQLQQLQRSLTSLSSTANLNIDGSFSGMTQEILKAKGAAGQLGRQLKEATDINTGKLDLSKFSASLKQSGMSVAQYRDQLLTLGSAGERAFTQLASSILKADAPLRKTSNLFTELKTTIANTARWQLSSSLIHGFMGAIQGAYGYAQRLNESLNNIQIVTGLSSEKMAQFAENANKAAKQLSTTTTSYTDAALIYYQQGIRDDKEIAERVETTIKLANVSGQSAQKVSDQMTAIWSNFADGSHNLEYYADVITALGAATASSSEEIATGLSKFAAVADTVGLSYENATAALATITATTRQSADTVGTGLRTLFARLQSLKLGETLDDGVSLTKYSKALESIGVSVLDTTGNLRSMDDILEDMGKKWQNLTDAQKTATAQTVGGVRQYTTLMALMENFDFYKENQQTALGSEGTVQKQADIYAQSWEAASKRVKASAESIYSELLNDKFFISLSDMFAKALNGVNLFIQGLGGLKGVLMGVFALATRKEGNAFANMIDRWVQNFKILRGDSQAQAAALQKETASALQMFGGDSATMGGATAARLLGEQGNLYQQLVSKAEQLSESQQKIAQASYDSAAAMNEEAINMARAADAAQRTLYTKARISQLNKGQTEADLNAFYGQMINAGRMQKTAQGLKSGIIDAESAMKHVGASNTAANTYSGRYLINALGRMSETAGSTKGLDQLKIKIDSLITDIEDKIGPDGILNLNKDITIAQELKSILDEIIQKTEVMRTAGFGNAGKGKTFKKPEQAEGATREAFGVGQELADADAAADGASEHMHQVNEEVDALNNKKITLGQQISYTVSSVMSLGLAISTVKGLIDTWNNEDLTIGEKLTTTMTSGAMAVMFLTSAYESFSKTAAFAAGKKLLLTTLTTIGIAQETAHATATGINAAAQLGLAGALDIVKAKILELYATIPPVLIVLALLAVIIGTVILAIKGIQAAANYIVTPKEAMDGLKASTEQAAEAAQKAKDAYQDLLNTFNTYDSAIDKLNEMTVGTIEFQQALLDANAAAMDLINNFGITEGVSYGENGEVIISDEARRQAKQKAYNEMQETEEQLRIAQAQENYRQTQEDWKQLQKYNNKARYGFLGNKYTDEEYLENLKNNKKLNTLLDQYNMSIEEYLATNGSFDQFLTATGGTYKNRNALTTASLKDDGQVSNLESILIDQYANNTQFWDQMYNQSRRYTSKAGISYDIERTSNKNLKKIYKDLFGEDAYNDFMSDNKGIGDKELRQALQSAIRNQLAQDYTDSALEAAKKTLQGSKIGKFGDKFTTQKSNDAIKQLTEMQAEGFQTETEEIFADQIAQQMEQSVNNYKDVAADLGIEGEKEAENIANAMKSMSFEDMDKIAAIGNSFKNTFGKESANKIFDELTTAVSQGNTRVMRAARGLDLSGDIIKDLAEVRKSFKGLENDIDLKGLLESMKKDAGGKKGIFEELYHSEDFQDNLKTLQKEFKKTGKIGAKSILDMADQSEYLQNMLDESGISAQGLADILETMELGDIGIEGLSEQLIEAFTAAGELDNTLAEVFSYIDNFQKERSTQDIGKFYKGFADSVEGAWKSAQFMDPAALQAWGEMFGPDSLAQYREFMAEITNDKNRTPAEIEAATRSQFEAEIKAMQSLQENGDLSGLFDYYGKKGVTKGGTEMFTYDATTKQVVTAGGAESAQYYKDNGWDTESGFIQGLQDNYGISPELARAMAAEYASTNASLNQLWRESAAKNGIEALIGTAPTTEYSPAKGVYEAQHLAGNGVTSAKELEAFYKQYQDVLTDVNGNKYDDFSAFLTDMKDQAGITGQSIVDLGDDFKYSDANLEKLKETMEKSEGLNFYEYMKKLTGTTDPKEWKFDDLEKAFTKLGYSADEAYKLIDQTINPTDGQSFGEAFKEQFKIGEKEWERFKNYLTDHNLTEDSFSSSDWADFLNTDEAERQLQHTADVMAEAIKTAFKDLFTVGKDGAIKVKIEAELDEESATTASEQAQQLFEENARGIPIAVKADVDPPKEDLDHLTEDFEQMQAFDNIQVGIKVPDQSGISILKTAKDVYNTLKEASELNISLIAPGEEEIAKVQSVVDQINQMDPTLKVTIKQVDENGNTIGTFNYDPMTGKKSYTNDINGATVETHDNIFRSAFEDDDASRARESLWIDGNYYGNEHYYTKEGIDSGFTRQQVADGAIVSINQESVENLSQATAKAMAPANVSGGSVTRQGNNRVSINGQTYDLNGTDYGQQIDNLMANINAAEKIMNNGAAIGAERENAQLSIEQFTAELENIANIIQKTLTPEKSEEKKSDKADETKEVGGKLSAEHIDDSAKGIKAEASVVTVKKDIEPIKVPAEVEDVEVPPSIDPIEVPVEMDKDTEGLSGEDTKTVTLIPETSEIDDYIAEVPSKTVNLLVGTNEPQAAIDALPPSHTLDMEVNVTVGISSAFGGMTLAGGAGIIGAMGPSIKAVASGAVLNDSRVQSFIEETRKHYTKGQDGCQYSEGTCRDGGPTGGTATGASIYHSYVNGSANRYSKPGISLTAEEGPEIVWNKQEGYAYIVGGEGHPEFTVLQPGDRVFNANDTRQILNYHRPKSNTTSSVKDPRDMSDELFGSHSVGYGGGFGFKPTTYGGKGGKAGGSTKEFKPERYHVITRQIQDLTFWYNELQKARENAYGVNVLDAIDKEIELVDELVKANSKLLEEVEDYKEKDLARLKELGIDAQIDEAGTILNYDELQEKYKKKADEEKDEEAQKAWDAITQYEETIDKWQEVKSELADQLYDYAELRLEKITVKAEMKVDFDDREIKYIQHFIDKIDDNLYKTNDVLKLFGSQIDLITHKISTAKQGIDDIFANMTDRYGNKINITYEQWLKMSDAEREALDINGKYGKQLEQFADDILDYIEALEEYKMKGVEEVSAAFDELNDKVNSQIDLFSHYSTMLSSLRDIADLQGLKLPEGFRQSINKLNQSMIQVTKNSIQSYKDDYIGLQKLAADTQNKINETTDENLKKAYQEDLDKIEAEMRSNVENVLQLWQDGLSKARDIFDQEMQWIQEDYEATFSELYNTADLLQSAFDRKKEINDEYVDDYEKYYQLGKLQRSINKDLDNAAINGNKQNKNLKALLEEIQKLQKDGTELSAYDLDILAKKYEYEKALADLEDARTAKQTVRLSRDRNGNWGYVYTAADGDELAEQEQAVEDKLYEYTKAATEQSASLQSEILNLWSEAGQKIAEMRAAGVSEDVIDDFIADTQTKLDFLMSQLEKTGTDLTFALPKWVKLTNESFDLIGDNFTDTILSLVTGMQTITDTGDTVMDAILTIAEATKEAAEAYNDSIRALNFLVQGNSAGFNEAAESWAKAIVETSAKNVENTKLAVNEMVSMYDQILIKAKEFEEEFEKKYAPIIEQNEKFLADLLNALGVLNGLPNNSTILTGANNAPANTPMAPQPIDYTTGPYTGVWDHSGKLTFTHDSLDIQSLLHAANILDTLDLQAGALEKGLGQLINPIVKETSQTLEQEVYITAEFPNATNHSEIEEAFNNLANRATQYANRKVG